VIGLSDHLTIWSSGHRDIEPFEELIWNKKPGMERRGHSDIHTDALASCTAWLQAVVQIATMKRNKDCRELQPVINGIGGIGGM